MKYPSARISAAASALLLAASIGATVVILLDAGDRSHHPAPANPSEAAAEKVDHALQQDAEDANVMAISYGDEEGTEGTAVHEYVPTTVPSIRTSAPTAHHQSTSKDIPFTFTGSLVDHPALGLEVAAGLAVRVVAQSGRRVEFASPAAARPHSGRCRFHVRPDGAAAFAAGPGHADGDWYYCSNSEVKEYQRSAANRCNGGMLGGRCRAGVYCLLFDGAGRVRDYRHRLGGDDMCGHNDGVGPDLPPTSTNCQGGVTPFDTYVSCEETGEGYCWQVDPRGRRAPERIEALGMSRPGEDKGGWEAMAVDDYTNPSCPVFFFSEDRVDGTIRRLRPDCGAVGDEDDGDGVARHGGWDMLHKGNIAVDYLEFVGGCGGSGPQKGRFRWTNNKTIADQSARSCYPYSEGIVATRGTVMFVTKTSDLIFTLDQATGEWRGIHSHANEVLSGEGNFQRSPDQITLDHHEDFMFLTTDGSSTPGVYIHSLQSGKYYTLWQSRSIGTGREESVGHAISPDGRFIVGALQKDGRVFLFAREDGEPFSGFDFALRRR